MQRDRAGEEMRRRGDGRKRQLAGEGKVRNICDDTAVFVFPCRPGVYSFSSPDCPPDCHLSPGTEVREVWHGAWVYGW